ncbi:pAS/PAC sensor signal transduction histidine kinase [Clostridium sp. CAG:306]|nr:PAS domain-containing protein [Clostridium sp.]CDC20611.1 pAS/PAC sensor signal transduction histidine kinase [Clostridium sp. CAG:306]
MSTKSISISTQNKLILLGLVISTVLIVGLAVFAITNIQQKISEVYAGFGEILTKTLAIESVEITKDVQEFDKFSTLQAHTRSIINSNNEIAFIEFKDADNKIIYSSKNDYPNRAKQALITSSSQMIVNDNGVKTNIGKVTVGLSGGATKDISHATRNSMLVVFTVAWLVFTLVILINTILITRELSMLHHGVKKISTGQFGYTLDDKNTSGEIKDLIHAFNDMSLRLHQYEEQNIDQLTLERNKFEAVLMSIVNGVVVCDNFDNVVLVNNAAKKMLEVEDEQILNTKIQMYCDTDGELCFKEKIEQFKDTPLDVMENKPLEFNIEVDNRVIKSVISPMFSKNQDYVGYVIVLIDVTKEVEIDKMKSNFISNVSHELRTPVTVLRTYIDTLYNHSDDFDEKTNKEFFEVINKEAARLQKMVNDILDFSRLEAGNVKVVKEKTNIIPLIECEIKSMQVLAEEKNITFSLIKEPNLPEIPINADSIERALNNLLSNAIKYSPENGRIKVRAEIARDPQFVEVSVEDQGCGIPEEHQKKIFERFYRVENDTHTVKGTGLGLHLVKITIEKHHQGQVFVKSKPNEGSTFGFRLPINPVEKAEDMEDETV